METIQIFTTQLCTPDNKTIVIPNASFPSGNITNYSTKPARRNDKHVLTDPAPQVAVSERADSSVHFVVRPWVDAADYWHVYYNMTETVKRRFDEEGISIPFLQRDVHIYQLI